MESPADKVPAKRQDIEGHEKAQIPHETMLEVLRWLDRFDLDGKQITSRRLRSRVENNQVPLRKVERVSYNGCYGPLMEPNWLRICVNSRDFVQLTFETDADIEKAADYLSSCFVCHFDVCVLPRNAVIAAPPLIHALDIRFCYFDKGEEDRLSATLHGSTFHCLSLVANSIPAWQINNELLESLRRRGCNEIELSPLSSRLDRNSVNYVMTEEGILSYCFTSDDDLPVPERRSLRIACATITPVFFKKLVKASKNSRLTCDVELSLQYLQLDVNILDVGVLPSRCREAHKHHVRYNFADHGNGVRLLIDFESKDGDEWEAVVRHGKKDREGFFESEEEEEEDDVEEDDEEEDDEED